VNVEGKRESSNILLLHIERKRVWRTICIYMIDESQHSTSTRVCHVLRYSWEVVLTSKSSYLPLSLSSTCVFLNFNLFSSLSLSLYSG